MDWLISPISTLRAVQVIESLLPFSGCGACIMLCTHSLSYIFCPQYSVWRMMRNMAETCICAALGASGIIAEVCPRDSPAHKRLRAVAPFMTSLLGRALVYIVFGMICSGNYTYVSSTSHKIDPTSRALAGIGDDISIRVNSAFWAFFCVISGMYMMTTGIITLVYYFKVNGSVLQSERHQELTATFLRRTGWGFGADRDASDGRSVSFSPFTPTTEVTAEGYQQQ
ncbi:hypothetical protein Pmar_PMAR018552 [Perkinsus marinus ATCC 50983]|uniref:Uncharacterized protein n=1 Tax=Perkinsus marinus (strain ATCC 50983 / TXsc) TaxID=423536 RepID=C5L050_PERM5|nr:hypothetical protein Pmar_PMAR018552 [Perkinsus marinus ATCC 50983]EER09908.1 hypothetical protein Pmar_PMAR018552 [Perkinsus marinus ATCC 50983]|eukprot:XP_002778113.1 hypothetical protein Pmar_PMAR018552 [Perkinsus marinus ATCC 50983]